jgi:hypothetical protein
MTGRHSLVLAIKYELEVFINVIHWVFNDFLLAVGLLTLFVTVLTVNGEYGIVFSRAKSLAVIRSSLDFGL